MDKFTFGKKEKDRPPSQASAVRPTSEVLDVDDVSSGPMHSLLDIPDEEVELLFEKIMVWISMAVVAYILLLCSGVVITLAYRA